MRRVNDIVPTDATEAQLRTLYGPDATAIIAMRRFLRLPKNEDGKLLTPRHWHAWALDHITSEEALLLDDLKRLA